MLRLPDNDYKQPEVLASWLELSALAQDNGLVVRGAVAEALRDSNLFADAGGSRDEARDNGAAGSAANMLDETWSVLESRRRVLQQTWPLQMTADRLGRVAGKETLGSTAAYSAMLLLEAVGSKWYGDTINIGPGDRIRNWFEHIVAAAIGQLIKGKTIRFGAPYPADWPTSFAERVEKLASEFGLASKAPEIVEYASAQQQDDSLDIVSRWRLVDEEPSSPFLLVQCATGANWITAKVAEPNLVLWRRYISWNGPTYKALAIPFALRKKGQLNHASVRHLDAIVFDRLRLATGQPDEFIEPALRQDLERWCREKFTSLAMASDISND